MNNQGTPWTQFASRAGSASNVTMYLPKVPVKHELVLDRINALVYTSAVGDYTTAKYVNIGIERGGRKLYLKGSDIGTGNTVIFMNQHVTLFAGDRIFVDFEATATSTTYEISAMGRLKRIEESA